MKQSGNTLTDLDIISPVSKHDLKALGVDEVAFVKKYKMNGQLAFVLHAADGTVVSVQNSHDNALTSANLQDLDVVLVH